MHSCKSAVTVKVTPLDCPDELRVPRDDDASFMEIPQLQYVPEPVPAPFTYTSTHILACTHILAGRSMWKCIRAHFPLSLIITCAAMDFVHAFLLCLAVISFLTVCFHTHIYACDITCIASRDISRSVTITHARRNMPWSYRIFN